MDYITSMMLFPQLNDVHILTTMLHFSMCLEFYIQQTQGDGKL